MNITMFDVILMICGGWIILSAICLFILVQVAKKAPYDPNE